jgi:hypothetical protein
MLFNLARNLTYSEDVNISSNGRTSQLISADAMPDRGPSYADTHSSFHHDVS